MKPVDLLTMNRVGSGFCEAAHTADTATGHQGFLRDKWPERLGLNELQENALSQLSVLVAPAPAK